MRKLNSICPFLALALVTLTGVCPAGTELGPETYLSPESMVADKSGRHLYIAEATAARVAVFDTQSRKVAKIVSIPQNPSGLVLSPDGSRLYVTGSSPAGRVYQVNSSSGKITMSVPTGHTPMSPVVSPDGKTLYVCNKFNDNVSVIDLRARKLVAKIRVERFPASAAITPDGRWLVVGNLLPKGPATAKCVSSAISFIDTKARKVAANIRLPDGSNAVRGVCVSPDGRYAYVTHVLGRYRLPTTQVERGWINTNAMSILDLRTRRLVNTVLLDDVTLGAANPWGVACTPDGKSICVTHAGSHELSVIDRAKLHRKLGKAVSREVKDDLSFVDGIRRRVNLNGNGPRGLVIVGSKIYVSDYFSDSLEICDISNTAREPMVLALGPIMPMTEARRGEMLFNDAGSSFQKWQSCASCHPDARSDGLDWDLMNDGLGNPKNSRSMLLSHRTPPVMSLGIRASAEVAVRAGLKYIEFSVRPEADAQAIDEYLKSLQPVPSPHLVNGKLSKSAKRGQKIFQNAGCASCHTPPLYTNLNQYDVGTGVGMDKGKKFDTSTLIECWRTAPYLSDGRAGTMKDVFRKFNPGNRHGTTSHLSDRELDDLVEFVLSL